MIYIAIMIAGLIAAYFLKRYNRQIKTNWHGTETDAVVSRIEKEELPHPNCSYPFWPCYATCYVRFRTEEGEETEAQLMNPKMPLNEGSRIRIKYLPEKDDLVILTEITDT